MKSLQIVFLGKEHEAREKRETLGEVINNLGVWEKATSGLAIVASVLNGPLIHIC